MAQVIHSGSEFHRSCRIKLWGRTIPSFIDHLCGHGITRQSGIFAVRAVFFDTNKLVFDTKKTARTANIPDYTVAAQVVNKTRYCSSPEFYTAVAGETLTQNDYIYFKLSFT